MSKQAQQQPKKMNGKAPAPQSNGVKHQSSAPQQKKQQQKPAAAPALPSEDEDDDNEEGEDEEDEDDMGEEDDSYASDEEEEGLEDLGEFLGFWANKCPADGEPIDVCAGHMRVLKIATAALGLDAPKGARASLVCCVPRPVAKNYDEEDEEDEDEEEDDMVLEEFVICTLSEARPDVQLELFYSGVERVQLKVVGNAEIHLTGSVSYMESGEEDYEEGDDEHAGNEDEEEEEGLYNEDGEVMSGVQAFEDSDDSEAEADAHGAAAVHRRDAAKAKAGARKKLPTIIQELMGAPMSDEEDDEDDGEDEEDDDDDSEDLDDLLTPANAERARQKLKGKIEVIPSPQLAPKKSPQQKPAATPKASPQQKPAAAPKSPQQKAAAAAPAAAATPSNKRKNESAAATPAPAAAQTPANKKAKTDAKTPAATPGAAAGEFTCAHCPRSFQQEAALKQHTVTKHAGAATPAKKA